MSGTTSVPHVRPGRRLDGLVAVVTGGNQGIGLGIAEVLGEAGAIICIWARDEEKSERAVSGLRDAGIMAESCRCDVTVENDVVRATEDVIRRHGALDVMVANAGAASNVPLLETSLEQWDLCIRTNLTSAFLCFREAARYMARAGRGGALIAVGSIASIHAAPTMHHYSSAKTGLLGLVRSVAVELAPHRIRVNAVLPGWTESRIHDRRGDRNLLLHHTTSSIPAGRWGSPREVGESAAFLADPTLWYQTGAELVVDGGYSKFPPYLAVQQAERRQGY